MANPTPNYNPFTFGNLGGSNSSLPGQAQDLYGHMGFGQSTVSGNNPAQSIIGQRFTPLLGSRIQYDLIRGNELAEPKHNAIRSMLMALSPGNRQAQVSAYGNRAMAGAMDSSRTGDMALRSAGIGTGTRGGAALGAVNQARMDTAGFDRQLNSPEGQMSALQAILAAIGAGQSTDLADFLAMNQSMEQNSQFRQANAGKSGLAGVLGNLAGTAFAGGWQPFGAR